MNYLFFREAEVKAKMKLLHEENSNHNDTRGNNELHDSIKQA